MPALSQGIFVVNLGWMEDSAVFMKINKTICFYFGFLACFMSLVFFCSPCVIAMSVENAPILSVIFPMSMAIFGCPCSGVQFCHSFICLGLYGGGPGKWLIPQLYDESSMIFRLIGSLTSGFVSQRVGA